MVALVLAANCCRGRKGMYYKGFGVRLHTVVIRQEPGWLVHREVQHTGLRALPYKVVTQLVPEALPHIALGVFAPQQD